MWDLGKSKHFFPFHKYVQASEYSFFYFFFDVVKNNSRKKTFSEFLNFCGRVCEGALSRKDSWKGGTEFEWTYLLVNWQGFISLEQDKMTLELYVLYQLSSCQRFYINKKNTYFIGCEIIQFYLYKATGREVYRCRGYHKWTLDWKHHD